MTIPELIAAIKALKYRTQRFNTFQECYEGGKKDALELVSQLADHDRWRSVENEPPEIPDFYDLYFGGVRFCTSKTLVAHITEYQPIKDGVIKPTHWRPIRPINEPT